MAEVLHYISGFVPTPFNVDRLQVRKFSADGTLSWSHHSLESASILLGALFKPGCDASRQDPLTDAGVSVP